MVKSSVKTKKKAVSKKKITKDSILKELVTRNPSFMVTNLLRDTKLKNQNTRIGIILGVILILLMLMANT